jgi:peptidoglycan/xylan/chitin deacetylase (PgdA/CDA1 family)
MAHRPLHVLLWVATLLLTSLVSADPAPAGASGRASFSSALGNQSSGWPSLVAPSFYLGAGVHPDAAQWIDRPQPNNIPTWPPPPVQWAQFPVNSSVAVYIPRGSAAPVPNVSGGHSDTITLTFDDCGTPDQMQAIVSALADVHEHGLFFITGQCRDHYPWLVGTLLAAGHQVCNHTYSHPDLRRLSDAGIRAEIRGGVMAGCPYFRPPFGAWDGPRGRIARIAAEFGLTPLLWDVDSRDWAGASPEMIAAAAHSRGGVVLLHLHGAHTAEAVRQIG